MLSIVISVLLLLLGLVILITGAELLVRGASSISKKVGIPSIVIGLTIVAFGTSAPELIVNIFSSVKGTTDLAVGNVIGSNIANILLIFGVSALIVDLEVKKDTTWKEIPFAMLAVLVIFFMANDILFDQGGSDVITRIDGLILLCFFSIFMYYTIELVRKNRLQQILQGGEEKITIYSTPLALAMTFGGLVALFFGGQLLVNQAITLATLAGLSEMLIGLTVVAIGTSLPEMATSIIAAKKGQSDIAIGNVVGSNIFNIFWILGVTSVISPLPISEGANIDIVVALLVTLALFLAMFVGKKQKLERWQGLLFIMVYVFYTAYLIYRG